jgi:hypothetical protein
MMRAMGARRQARARATKAVADKREPGQRLVLGALLALAFLLGCFPMADFDVWWHLRTGQLILSQGDVPRVDMFTYTNAGQPWIDIYWLFQVAIALLYRAGGVPFLVLFKATCGTAVVGLALLARRPGARLWPAILAWIPAVVMLSGRLCERPELLSLLFIAGFLVVLARAAEHPRWLWLLPGIELLWVNCHGFFIFGPLILAAYHAELAFDRHLPPLTPIPRPPLPRLKQVSVAVLLACLINPYGFRAIGLPLQQFRKIAGSDIYRASIGELKTIGDFISENGFNNPYLLAFFVLLALGVASFIVRGRRRHSPFLMLLFVSAAYLGWQATRNSALFALVAAFVIVENLDWTMASCRVEEEALSSKRAPHGRSVKPARPRRGENRLLLAPIAMLGLATVTGVFYEWGDEGRTIGLGERRQWYAHGACEFLARPDLPERIAAFNLGQAAVCIAVAGPAHKLFLDPRLEVNSRQTFERYVAGIRKLWRGEDGWEGPLGIDYARPNELPALLVERGVLGRAIAVLLNDPRWRCVYVDALATVFVPTAFAEAHKLPEASL